MEDKVINTEMGDFDIHRYKRLVKLRNRAEASQTDHFPETRMTQPEGYDMFEVEVERVKWTIKKADAIIEQLKPHFE